jgi:hypothetical protein
VTKPGDLCRTPSGRTVRVKEVISHRFRSVVDVLNGDEFELADRLLYVVVVALPIPWSRRAQ